MLHITCICSAFALPTSTDQARLTGMTDQAIDALQESMTMRASCRGFIRLALSDLSRHDLAYGKTGDQEHRRVYNVSVTALACRPVCPSNTVDIHA